MTSSGLVQTERKCVITNGPTRLTRAHTCDLSFNAHFLASLPPCHPHIRLFALFSIAHLLLVSSLPFLLCVTLTKVLGKEEEEEVEEKDEDTPLGVSTTPDCGFCTLKAPHHQPRGLFHLLRQFITGEILRHVSF